MPEVRSNVRRVVINTENATAEDVVNVITHAQEEVLKRNNIKLETEVKRLGF